LHRHQTLKDGDSLLDLVVGNEGSRRVQRVAVQSSHLVSDHDLVTWSITSDIKSPRQVIDYRFRNLRSVDWFRFQCDVRESTLFTDPASTPDAFADQLDSVVSEILNHHCPLQLRRKFAARNRDSRWLSTQAVEAKRTRRGLERKWRSTKCEVDYVAYRKACRSANKAIIDSRTDFYKERINSARADLSRRWTAVKDVLHLTQSADVLPPEKSKKLCDNFAAFFTDKIRT
jgi:hypothetical protein